MIIDNHKHFCDRLPSIINFIDCWGPVRVQGNSDGTAFDRRSLLPLSALINSYSLKCLEQTLVHSCIWKYTPSSLLIAWIHFVRWSGSSGNLKWERFLPFSFRKPFFVHSAAARRHFSSDQRFFSDKFPLQIVKIYRIATFLRQRNLGGICMFFPHDRFRR